MAPQTGAQLAHARRVAPELRSHGSGAPQSSMDSAWRGWDPVHTLAGMRVQRSRHASSSAPCICHGGAPTSGRMAGDITRGSEATDTRHAAERRARSLRPSALKNMDAKVVAAAVSRAMRQMSTAEAHSSQRGFAHLFGGEPCLGMDLGSEVR